MQDDYAKAVGSPAVVTIQGKTYKVGKFTPRDLGDLQAFIKEQVPDPRLMARVLCEGMSDTVALRIWQDLSAEASEWPPSLTSYQGNQILMTTHKGAACLLWVTLRRHNAITEAEALEMAKDVSQAELNEVVRRAFPEDAFDPKAIPATEPEQPTKS